MLVGPTPEPVTAPPAQLEEVIKWIGAVVNIHGCLSTLKENVLCQPAFAEERRLQQYDECDL